MQPTITTARLVLRPFHPDDAPAVQLLANEYDIACNTALLPHPYPLEAAVSWIATHAEAYAADRRVQFAITLRDSGTLIGAIGLAVERAHQRAELGYWIGKPYWGHGYCTEAAQAVVAFGFRECRLRRIVAEHLARNRASGRVLEKIGMQLEGISRQHFVKWNETHDVYRYGILCEEFAQASEKSFSA